MTESATSHLSSRPISPQGIVISPMGFSGRLAACGYCASSMINCILYVEAGSSQNRAWAINAHGFSSLLSLRLDQIHQDQRSRQWELFQKLPELFHRHAATLPATVQAPKEQLTNSVNISTNSVRVVCESIVSNMPADFSHYSMHQLGYRTRSVCLQPFFQRQQLGLEFFRRGQAFHPESPASRYEAPGSPGLPDIHSVRYAMLSDPGEAKSGSPLSPASC